jgi:hypothetical protein
MSSVAIYQIGCPRGHTIELPETILEGILLHLRGSYKGEPVLNFVCSECKTAFHYDYPNTEPAGWTDAPRQISEFHVLSVQTGCDDSYCGEHVVLVAVRNLDISAESLEQEKKTWNVSGVKCKNGYQALPIGTPKRSSFQFFAGSL